MKLPKDIKYHKSTLELIEEFTKPQKGQLKILNSTVSKVSLIPHANKFEVDCKISLFGSLKQKILKYEEIRKSIFVTKKHELIFEDMYISSLSTTISTKGNSEVKGHLNKFYTKGFNKSSNYYYRLFIPTNDELNFRRYFEKSFYSSDLGYKSVQHITTIYDNSKIELYSIHYNNKYYVVIDYDRKTDYENFSKIVFAMLVSYGYISGFMPGEKGYFVAYKNKVRKKLSHFYFNSLRGEIKSGYCPVSVYTAGYGIPTKIDYSITPITKEVFSKLFAYTHESLEFSSVLLLILESSVSSLLFMPCGYAVSLETLSDIIIDQFEKEKKINLAPIKDKKLRRKVIKECNEVIIQNCTGVIEPGFIDLLNERITSNLNKPTNKDRLKAPFDLLKIALNERDNIVLNTRNDFLHGRIAKLDTLEKTNLNIFDISSTFYTLLSSLIMKWSGYDGRIVNYPKVYEGHNGTKIDGDYFKQI